MYIRLSFQIYFKEVKNEKKMLVALIVSSTQSSVAELSVDPPGGQSCQSEAHYCYYGNLKLPCDPTEKTEPLSIQCENGDQYTMVKQTRIGKNTFAPSAVKFMEEEFSLDISGCQIVRQNKLRSE